MMNKSALALAAGLALLASGCAAPGSYGDARTTLPQTQDQGASQLQGLANQMVASLLASPGGKAVTRNGKPVLFVDNLRNQTAEPIDVGALTQTVRARLQRSGKFRFVDNSRVHAIQQQLEYQSGRVDPAAMVRLGKQTGAHYMLYGNLSSIVGKDGGSYYRMSLTLMELKSGELVWSDRQAIRSRRSQAALGW